MSMVRFRSKTCRIVRLARGLVVRGRFRVAKAPAGECGVKDQVNYLNTKDFLYFLVEEVFCIKKKYKLVKVNSIF